MASKFAVFRGRAGVPVADPAFGGEPAFRWRLVGQQQKAGASRPDDQEPAWRVHKWDASLEASVAKGELERRGPIVVAEDADEAARLLAEHLVEAKPKAAVKKGES